jgi:hypothetical protein
VDQQVIGYGRVEYFVALGTNFKQGLYSEDNPPTAFIIPYVLAIISPIPSFSIVSGGGFVRYKLNSGGSLAKPEVVDANDV